MKFSLLTVMVWSISMVANAAHPARPVHYPRSYDALIEAAEEGRDLLVYGNIDADEAAPVVEGFRHRYPGVRINYVDLNARELYDRFVSETAARRPSADLVISSAMDLQIKLINDDYAQPYASPEKPALPADAVWKDEGYGVTAEPIVFVYNRQLIPDRSAPRTHADLTAFLARSRAKLRGKVATFDPSASGVGYLYLLQDLALTRDTWGLLGALSATRPALLMHSQDMIDGVASGRYWISYNAVGSYALERARKDSRLGVVFPQDYTLTMSRIALIPNRAAHPEAAKLFLDYLLSPDGQRLLARKSLLPIRSDVAAAISKPSSARAAPIRVGPQLMAGLDQISRQRFLRRWAEIQKDNR
jgi:iron(III) transport system substrate-binding protein